MSDNATRADVLKILAAHGITFATISRGRTPGPNDSYAFDVVLSRKAGLNRDRVEALQVPYTMGPGCAVKHANGRVEAPTPQAADVLYALLQDGEANRISFAEWCSNYGFDVDSIKGLDTYLRCQDTGDGLARLFGPGGLDDLRSALQDF